MAGPLRAEMRGDPIDLARLRSAAATYAAVVHGRAIDEEARLG